MFDMHGLSLTDASLFSCAAAPIGAPCNNEAASRLMAQQQPHRISNNIRPHWVSYDRFLLGRKDNSRESTMTG